MGKFWKYVSTSGSRNSETPRPNVPIECLQELHLLLYVHAKNQLDYLISSTNYVKDNAHLCLGRTKTKWNEKKQSEKSKNFALLGLAVPVEYLSNLHS